MYEVTFLNKRGESEFLISKDLGYIYDMVNFKKPYHAILKCFRGKTLKYRMELVRGVWVYANEFPKHG